MIELYWPWLLAALPLPWLAYRFLPVESAQQAALLVPFFARTQAALGQNLTATPLSWPSRLLALIMWLCLVPAACRPEWVGPSLGLPSSGRDLLLAVDISGSMQETDMEIGGNSLSRLEVTQMVVGDFVKRRENDRLGLVLFGSNAYLQAPLTQDRQTVDHFLQEARIGFAGEQTAIGEAIGLSIKRLKDQGDKHKVLILLTDGANTAGAVDPLSAAQLAKEAGVKIYTLGLGSDGGRPSLFGLMASRSEIDEDSLKQIAQITGGRYFRAKDPQELAQIYSELDQLEPIERSATPLRPKQRLFHWPLGAALGCALLLILIRLPHWRRFRLASPRV